MSDVIRILFAIEQGDPHAADQLLPRVYAELRKLAAQRLAKETPGQTLQATDLVHEAYLRLIGDQQFSGRNNFFAAAAVAMRRILIERARRKGRQVHGGEHQRVELTPALVLTPESDETLLAIDEALTKFAELDPLKAKLVELRFFGGLTSDQAAAVLDLSPSTADRHWVFARAWLRRELKVGAEDKSK